MKKILLSIWLLLPFLLIAQPTITKTEAFPTTGKITVEGILREPGSNNLLVVYEDYSSSGLAGKNKWAVDVFSNDLQRLKAGIPEKMEFPGGEDVNFGMTVSLGGSANIIFHRYDKKEKEVLLYRAQIESAGKIGTLNMFGTLRGKEASLFDVFMGASRNLSHPITAYSVDTNYLFLMRSYSDDKMKEPPTYIIVDRNWNIVRQGSLKFPDNEEVHYLLTLPAISNDGSIWMPIWTKTGDQPETTQEVWVWKDANELPKRISITLSTEKLITDMRLQQSATDQMMYVGGMYSESSRRAQDAIFRPTSPPNDNHPAQGTFIAKIDAHTDQVITTATHPFEASTLQYWDRDQKDIEKGRGINLIRPVGVHPQADGSIWLNTEQYIITPERTSPGGLLTIGGDPTYGPAIIVHYTADDKETKELVIGKSTYLSIDRHGSHFFDVGKNGIFLLYNDHGGNVETPPARASNLRYGGVPNSTGGGIPIVQKQACTAMYYADTNGQGKPECLFRFRETDYWLEPQTYIQTAPGVYIFACEGKDGEYGLLKAAW